MTTYEVLYFNRATWDKQDPRIVEANSAKEAAEVVCGQQLSEHGSHGELRAEAWEPGKPKTKTMFYLRGA